MNFSINCLNGKTHGYFPLNPYRNSQTLEVDFELIINYELERLILSYADSVKVIQPQSLIERIKRRMEMGFNQYH